MRLKSFPLGPPMTEARLDPVGAYSVAKTADCAESFKRLSADMRQQVDRILTRLGWWVDENPGTVVRRGAGFVYRHSEPRVEITFCVNSEERRLTVTWTEVPLPRRLMIFLSYSHRDTAWPVTFQKYLCDLESVCNVRHWIDQKIEPGELWRVAIDEAMSGASIAVLFVTQDFLASNFIRTVELPQLLHLFVHGRLDLGWIAVRVSTVMDTELSEIQALGNTDVPLSQMTEAEVEQELLRVYGRLKV